MRDTRTLFVSCTMTKSEAVQLHELLTQMQQDPRDFIAESPTIQDRISLLAGFTPNNRKTLATAIGNAALEEPGIGFEFIIPLAAAPSLAEALTQGAVLTGCGFATMIAEALMEAYTAISAVEGDGPYSGESIVRVPAPTIN